MSEVASECCGSCGWYCWNSYLSKYNCHNSEIVKQHKQDDFIPESLCSPNYYSPRNPLPIIDLPGVKELIETAYRAGCMKGGEWLNGVREQEALDEYIKALEAKNG